MAIERQVVLRYRAEGHLRFDVPAILADPPYQALVVDGLQEMDGLYRVSLSRSGKLSIRYDSAVCAFSTVVQRLRTLLNAISEQSSAAVISAAQVSGAIKLPLGVAGIWSRLKTWIREKYRNARKLVRPLRERAASAIAKPPQWLTDFLMDALTLYLVKIHWQQITHAWLLNPWRYRYEWAATLYLIYLLVQSRVPPAARG